VSANGAPPPTEQALALVRDGRSFFAQGDVERARACFAAAVEIAPHDPSARSGLERCERLLAEGVRGSDPAGARPPPAHAEAGDSPDLDDGGSGPGVGEEATEAVALGSGSGRDDGPDQVGDDGDDVDVDIEPEATVVDPMAARRVEAELERAREEARAAGRDGDAAAGARSRARRGEAGYGAIGSGPERAVPEPSSPAGFPTGDAPGSGRVTGGGPRVLHQPPGHEPPGSAFGPGFRPGHRSGPHGIPPVPPGMGQQGPQGDEPDAEVGSGQPGFGPGNGMDAEKTYPRHVGAPSPQGRPPPGPPIHALPDAGPQSFASYPPQGGPGPAAFPHVSTPIPSAYSSGPMSMVGRLGLGTPTTRTTQYWVGVAFAVGLGCTAFGLVLGWVGFSTDGEGGEAKPAARAPAGTGDENVAKVADPSGVAGAPGAEMCPDGRPCPPGLGAGAAASAPLAAAVEARVTRVEHPVVAVAEAPASGEVERVHVKAGGAVTTGQKLYTLREGKGGVRDAEAVVNAPAAGRIERRAARGDQVRKGDVLAQLVDPAVWLVISDLTSDAVTMEWTCQVSTAEGRNRAPCRVESVQRLGGEQSRLTASVISDVASWLQGGGQELVLALAPPTGTPAGNAVASPASRGSATPTASATAPPASSTGADKDRNKDDDSDEDEAAGTAPNPAATPSALTPAAPASSAEPAAAEPSKSASPDGG
jgi:hypothetical protein